jgi:FlaA1/EpsC-like NDP-sugar epimerase
MRPGEKLHEELYEGTEDVADTVHPSILNIRQPQHFESPDFFVGRLEDLLDTHLDSDNALSTLRQFIQERDAQPQYEMAMQQIKIG